MCTIWSQQAHGSIGIAPFLHLMSCESSNIGAARQPDDISQVTRSHHNELYFELCQGPITTTTLVNNRIPAIRLAWLFTEIIELVTFVKETNDANR